MKKCIKLLLSGLTALLILAGPMSPFSQAAEDKPATVAKEAEKAKAPVVTAKASIFSNDIQKLSYVFGSQIGQSMKAQKMEIDLEFFVKAINDALEGNEPALTKEEEKKVMDDYRTKMIAKQKIEAEANQALSKVFLTENKAKEGVVELPSGLQYKVIKEGIGATPTASDKVKTHYRGTLTDGEEFDSSYKRGTPAEFGVTGVIKGWTEALQLMKEGAKWELYIPADLAYGPQGRPGIPPNSTLIFELELLEVVKTGAANPITLQGKTATPAGK